MENKEQFVADLGELLKQTREFSNLYRMDYVNLKDKNLELAYATFNDGTQKFVNVTADSTMGILTDVITRLEDKAPLTHDNKLFREDFLPEGIEVQKGQFYGKV